MDLYEYTQTLIEKFVKDSDSTVWQILRQTATLGMSARSFNNFLSHLHKANQGMDGKLCTRE